MSNIDNILDAIIEQEGGYQANPADSGNYYKGHLIGTNLGISAPVLAAFHGGAVTVEDMRSLSLDVARQIYRQNYIEAPGLDKLPGTIIAQVADMAVNHGPARAVRIVQEGLELAGFPCGVDGAAGPKTRAAAIAAAEQMGPFLTNAIADARASFYRSIATGARAQFLRGWLTRAYSFRVPI